MKNLSGRPGKFPASEQVEVQVKDTLPGVGTDIGHKTVAALIEPQCMSQFCSNHEQPGQQSPILFCQIGHRSDMTPGDEHDVIRRLWINIFKRHHIFVLVHNFTRYLTLCNSAEQAVIHMHSSLQEAYSNNYASPVLSVSVAPAATISVVSPSGSCFFSSACSFAGASGVSAASVFCSSTCASKEAVFCSSVCETA